MTNPDDMRRLMRHASVLLLIAFSSAAILCSTRPATPSSGTTNTTVPRVQAGQPDTHGTSMASTLPTTSGGKGAASADQDSQKDNKGPADKSSFSSLATSDRIALWAMIVGAITALATICQACVTYLIARSIGKASELSESLQISREIDRIWQDFNHQAIVNEEFRNTIRSLESLSEDTETTQLRHLIFYILNIIYISWTAQKSRRDNFDHSKTIVKDHLAILYSKRDPVLSILNGHRGYNKTFVQDCVLAFAQMDQERTNSSSKSDSGVQQPEPHSVPEVDSAMSITSERVAQAAATSEQPQPEDSGKDAKTRQDSLLISDVGSGSHHPQLDESTLELTPENIPPLLTRLARPDEWKTLQALNLQIFEFELENCEATSNLQYPFSPEGEQYFQKAAQQQDNYAAIVAEQEGVVVGYAIVKRIPASDLTHRVGVTQYQLHTLSVEKSHRDKGIGGELVDAAKAFAKGQGANRLKVVAYALNARADHLYKKKGFAELEITYETTL